MIQDLESQEGKVLSLNRVGKILLHALLEEGLAECPGMEAFGIGHNQLSPLLRMPEKLSEEMGRFFPLSAVLQLEERQGPGDAFEDGLVALETRPMARPQEDLVDACARIRLLDRLKASQAALTVAQVVQDFLRSTWA
jgi:hypothetical protein